MSKFDEFQNKDGHASFASSDSSLFGKAFRNVAVAVTLAGAAMAASAGGVLMESPSAGGVCADGAAFVSAKASGQQSKIESAMQKISPALVQGLRTFMNANGDQAAGIDHLTNKALDASGTKGETAANDALNAAKQVSFLASAHKAAGAAQAAFGGDAAKEVTSYFQQCNGNSDKNPQFLAKAAESLSSAKTEPTLKESMMAAIKEVKPTGAAEAGVKVLTAKTDFSHEGEVLKPLSKLPSLAKYIPPTPDAPGNGPGPKL